MLASTLSCGFLLLSIPRAASRSATSLTARHGARRALPYWPGERSAGSGFGANLTRSDNCAELVFGVPTRIGDNGTMASGELRESQYSVVLGLLKYGLQYQSKVGPEGQPAGIIGKLKGLFN